MSFGRCNITTENDNEDMRKGVERVVHMVRMDETLADQKILLFYQEQNGVQSDARFTALMAQRV